MKYRIKIITYENGRKVYCPQFRTRLKWAGIDYDGSIDFTWTDRLEKREWALDRIDKHYEGNSKKQTIEFEYIKK